MFKATFVAAVMLLSGASADYVTALDCEHAPLGDENAMLREADCLFAHSDRNKDGRLSQESTRGLIHGYLKRHASPRFTERIIFRVR